MNFGLIAIGICVVSLLASLTMDMPAWTNLMGIASGAVGVFLLGRNKGGGA